jgi:hypothetical protein
MTQKTFGERAIHEGLITALAVGGVFILIGLVAILSPNFFDNARAFFRDFTNVNYMVGSNTINLPAPAHPAQHNAFFTAIMDFIVGVAILQIIILPLRLWFKSPIRRIAETVGNLVFWVGAAVVANVFLLAGTVDGWFQCWATLIILVGVSLIARGLVIFARRF